MTHFVHRRCCHENHAMAELPLLPLHVQALLADTNHLSTEEFGAYCLILFTMWEHGGRLPDDPAFLAKCTRMRRRKWSQLSRGILRPLTRAGGFLSQKRLTDTWLKVQEVRRQRAVAGSKGGRTRVTQLRQAIASNYDKQSSSIKISKKERESFFVEGREFPPVDNVDNPAPPWLAEPPQEAGRGSKEENKIFVTPELEKIMAAKLGRRAR
jgi:uncharacterized protein YdaU (DUF1376 family)